MLFPNQEALQNARKGVVSDIRQEYQKNNCQDTTSLKKLFDQCHCLKLDALVAKEDNYIATGIFYGIQESTVYQLKTNNNNPHNIQDFPYGNCYHNLMVRTPDKSEPLTVHRHLMSLCTDPITNEYIKTDLADLNSRYLQ